MEYAAVFYSTTQMVRTIQKDSPNGIPKGADLLLLIYFSKIIGIFYKNHA